MKLPFSRYIKAHHISHAALSACAIVAALMFFVVGAGLRLLWGPVSLGPLRGTLAGAIHDALPGIALDYDTAAIEWTRDQNRVNLVVLGTRILDSRGKVVARAPKAAIALAAAPFLHGKFVVRRITLVGVELGLVHLKSGQIRLGSQKDEASDDIIGRISDVIDARGSESSSLQSFSVRNARLTVYDEVTGLSATAPRANVTIRAVKQAGGDALGASLDADLLLSGRTSHVTAELTVPPDNTHGKQPVIGSVKIAGLDIRGLGAASKMFDSVRTIAITADASAGFSLAPGGALAAADFDITGRGQIPFAAMTGKALHVTALRLAGHYDGKSRHLALTTADLDAKEARAALKGSGDFVLGDDGKLAKVHAELSGRNLALDMPGIFQGKVTYQTVAASLDYITATRRFDFTKLSLTAPGFALDGAAAVTLNDAGAPGLVAKAHIPALPVRTLLKYWPMPLAPGAREWIDANVLAGNIGPLDAQSDFAPGMLDQDILPEDSLKVTFGVANIEGTYVKGLTHATGVSGDAILTGDTFKANFTGGRIGNLIARSGSALIPNLHQTGTVGQFAVHIDGAMTDVMTLIDMKPLGYATKFGIDPRQTGGSASADLSFKVPMLADLPVDNVGIDVKADVQDFAVSLGSHTRITNGAVHFDIDNAHLHQTGAVNLADARLNVDWTEDFRTKDPVTTRLAVKGTMTEAGRHMLNINLDRYFRGTVPVTADLTGHRGSLLKADAQIDFTPATLSVPIVNLEKSPGQAASGHVVVNFGPGDTPTDETIRITGPVMNATGSATFARDGSLSVLSFPSVKMGALNDLSFQLTHTGNSNDYVLRGRSLDGSRIGRNGTNEAPGGANATVDAQDDTPEGRFHINAQLGRLAMRDNVSIAPFNMDLAGIGNRPAALTLNGSLTMGSKSAPIAAGLEATAAGRKVTLTAGDAGMLARGLFAFESMRGGELSATVNLPGQAGDIVNPNNPAPDFAGTLTVKDFTVINQPMLARLFSAGSLTGLGDLMGGDGMTMDELTLPFSSKNNVIGITNARAVGRAIGASADGYIDRPHGTIALKGSLIPAYGVNSLISNVPLIGDLLASKKGEGIFGITYSATGNSDQPTISTNVLSMLTPGILRRIFEGHIPTAANAPTNQAQQPAPPKAN